MRTIALILQLAIINLTYSSKQVSFGCYEQPTNDLPTLISKSYVIGQSSNFNVSLCTDKCGLDDLILVGRPIDATVNKYLACWCVTSVETKLSMLNNLNDSAGCTVRCSNGDLCGGNGTAGVYNGPFSLYGTVSDGAGVESNATVLMELITKLEESTGTSQSTEVSIPSTNVPPAQSKFSGISTIAGYHLIGAAVLICLIIMTIAIVLYKKKKRDAKRNLKELNNEALHAEDQKPSKESSKGSIMIYQDTIVASPSDLLDTAPISSLDDVNSEDKPDTVKTGDVEYDAKLNNYLAMNERPYSASTVLSPNVSNQYDTRPVHITYRNLKTESVASKSSYTRSLAQQSTYSNCTAKNFINKLHKSSFFGGSTSGETYVSGTNSYISGITESRLQIPQTSRTLAIPDHRTSSIRSPSLNYYMSAEGDADNHPEHIVPPPRRAVPPVTNSFLPLPREGTPGSEHLSKHKNL